MNKAVFLDRDGTINEIVYFPELGIIDSPLNPEQFKLLPKAAKGIKILNGLGLKVIIVSNQPVIAKGKTSIALFDKIRVKMKKELEKNGSYIDGEYYCFHHPEAKLIEYRENCDCRKPKPGLLLRASEDFNIDLSHSYIIGDSLMDIEAGKAAGCKTFLIGKEKCDFCKFMEEKKIIPDYIIPDLFSASRIIENNVNNEEE